jgi:hypothetical protein
MMRFKSNSIKPLKVMIIIVTLLIGILIGIFSLDSPVMSKVECYTVSYCGSDRPCKEGWACMGKSGSIPCGGDYLCCRSMPQ